MQILILDDHSSIRGLLVSLLDKEYNVVTGRDGMEGIQLLKQGLIPDLIILDMFMPNLDGLEFLDFIRSSGIFKSIPVIVLSGSEHPDIKNSCIDKKIEAYIAKPFNPILLKERIKQILNLKFETNSL